MMDKPTSDTSFLQEVHSYTGLKKKKIKNTQLNLQARKQISRGL